MRLGTTKSRAPSGVERVRIGVSMSRKPARVQVVADRLRDPVAQLERALHRLAAQVEVAVAQAQRLVDRASSSSSGKGGVSAAASTSSRVARISTSPVGMSGLTVSSERRTTSPAHRDHPLGAQLVRARVRLGRGLRVEHDLHEAGAVAQVDEHEAAVVAAPVDPAGDSHLLADAVRRAPRRTRRRGRRSRAAAQAGHGAGSSSSSQAGERHLVLVAAAHVAHGRGLALPLLGADDHDPRRAEALGLAHLGLHATGRRGPWSRRSPPRAAPRSTRKTRSRARGSVTTKTKSRAAPQRPRAPRATRSPSTPAPARCARGPVAQPAAGRRRSPPSCSIRPVVAAAAADAALRAERVAAELEHRARVVVEAAHQARVEHVVDRRRRRAAGAPPRSARASAGERRSTIFGAASVTATISGSSQSNARIGLISIRARCSASNTSWPSRWSRSSRAYSARDSGVADAGQVEAHAGQAAGARTGARAGRSARRRPPGRRSRSSPRPSWACWR